MEGLDSKPSILHKPCPLREAQRFCQDSPTPHNGQCLPSKSKVSPQPCAWYRTLYIAGKLNPLVCMVQTPYFVLGGRSGYFLFFFCSGMGMGESEALEVGGSTFFFIIPRKGGGSRRGRGRGPGRASAANWGIGEFGGGG